MNKQQIFNHPAFGELPILVDKGVEWFGAVEAARSLSFSNPHKAIEHHVEKEDCTVHTVLTNGGKQQKKFVNEVKGGGEKGEHGMPTLRLRKCSIRSC